MMFDLVKFRKLKQEYDLEPFEWWFVAFFAGGVDLALAEGPEVVLSKAMERERIEENVESVQKLLSEREQKILSMMLMRGLSFRQAGEEFDVTTARIRQIFMKAMRKVQAPGAQWHLLGMGQLRVKGREEMQERAALQEKLQKDLVRDMKKQRDQLRQELQPRLEEDLEVLHLPPVCLMKLKALGLTTVQSLLEHFPYNAETNELEHFLEYQDSCLTKADYFEVWNALYERNLLVQIPTLPKCLLTEDERAEFYPKRHDADLVRAYNKRVLNEDLYALKLTVIPHRYFEDELKVNNRRDFYKWCKRRDIGSIDELAAELSDNIWGFDREDLAEVLQRMHEHGWLDSLA